jgi:hypothetical protein
VEVKFDTNPRAFADVHRWTVHCCSTLYDVILRSMSYRPQFQRMLRENPESLWLCDSAGVRCISHNAFDMPVELLLEDKFEVRALQDDGASTWLCEVSIKLVRHSCSPLLAVPRLASPGIFWRR